MRHQLLSSSITTMPSSILKPLKANSPNYPSLSPSPSPSPSCKHSSPSATTLDLLILILVLFSGSFLLTSYCSYIITSLSLLLPSLSLSLSSLRLSFNPSHLYYLVFTLSFLSILTLCEICCLPRSRKCANLRCKGLKKCMEFDLQMIKEPKGGTPGVRRKNGEKSDWTVQEIDDLPWKGGTETNPDYECLRAELRKIAPTNGKAILLFRAKCGCPVAKLEGWGPKRGRRLKKSSALNGGGDHR